MRRKARQRACRNIAIFDCPFACLLAMEKGRAMPTIKEKAGWMRSWSEHPVQMT